ncbi:MAG TPA: hypothetical protein VGF79_00955 [Bacteroidia bacterium]
MKQDTTKKQQTAVEYLVERLKQLRYLHSDGYGQSHAVTLSIKQAKEKERAQIENAYNQGLSDNADQLVKEFKNAEQYFEQTFNQS